MTVFWGLIIMFILFLLWRIYFLRNPTRHIPPGEDTIVAPADGYVIYIKRIEQGEVPMAIKKNSKILLHELCGVEGSNSSSGWLIGIFMTPWSVHFNRTPLAGKITFKTHIKNKLELSMVTSLVEIITRAKKFSDNDYYLMNERLTTAIKTTRGPTIFVTQIADKWINRIVSFVEEGDEIAKGAQYGMIRFGSQCDLFVPDELKISFNVNIGDYIYAGDSIIGTVS